MTTQPGLLDCCPFVALHGAWPTPPRATRARGIETIGSRTSGLDKWANREILAGCAKADPNAAEPWLHSPSQGAGDSDLSSSVITFTIWTLYTRLAKYSNRPRSVLQGYLLSVYLECKSACNKQHWPPPSLSHDLSCGDLFRVLRYRVTQHLSVPLPPPRVQTNRLHLVSSFRFENNGLQEHHISRMQATRHKRGDRSVVAQDLRCI